MRKEILTRSPFRREEPERALRDEAEDALRPIQDPE